MFELPETICMQKQMQNTLIGKKIKNISLLKSEKLERWGFVTQTQEEFNRRLYDQKITGIESKTLYLYINTDSENTLILGEFDGKILYHTDKKSFPKKVYLQIDFFDSTHLTTTVQLWGMMKVFNAQEKMHHIQKVEQKGKEPISNDFTFNYFRNFIANNEDIKKLNVKKFITSGVCVSGLANGYLQEILFRAKIHPKRKLHSLILKEYESFYDSVIDVVDEAIQKGGRSTERDFFNLPGSFYSRLNKNTVGTECSDCGQLIEKIHFEGGACYICPSCQIFDK